jgi:hypothetical protein
MPEGPAGSRPTEIFRTQKTGRRSKTCPAYETPEKKKM